MSEYTPNIDAVNQLRGELIEVLNDYLLLVMFNGISGPDDVQRLFFSLLNGLRGDEDLSSEPSFLARQREEGVTTARRLLQVLGEIDDVLATGLLGVADSWPRWVSIRWEYAGVHERSKPLRELALGWKIDLTALVSLGRPRGSFDYPTPESIVMWLGPHIRALRNEHRSPTKDRVAEAVNLPTDTMMHHVRRHFKWTELLAAVKDS
jgi:hypothetical protein